VLVVLVVLCAWSHAAQNVLRADAELERTCMQMNSCSQCSLVSFCGWCPEQNQCVLSSSSACNVQSCSAHHVTPHYIDKPPTPEHASTHHESSSHEQAEHVSEASSHVTHHGPEPEISHPIVESSHKEESTVEPAPESTHHESSSLSQSDIANILSNTASALSDASSSLQSNVASEESDTDWLAHLEMRVASLEKKVFGSQQTSMASSRSSSSFQRWHDSLNGPFESGAALSGLSGLSHLESSLSHIHGESSVRTEESSHEEAAFRAEESEFHVLSEVSGHDFWREGEEH